MKQGDVLIALEVDQGMFKACANKIIGRIEFYSKEHAAKMKVLPKSL